MGYEGDTCSFKCNTDFELSGRDTRTCQSDGSWSGEETMCEKGTFIMTKPAYPSFVNIEILKSLCMVYIRQKLICPVHFLWIQVRIISLIVVLMILFMSVFTDK